MLHNNLMQSDFGKLRLPQPLMRGVIGKDDNAVKEDKQKFDWHCDLISKSTLVTDSYKNTQNVRRFLKGACGPDFKFDREFMSWIKDGQPKTMGEVALEWLRRNGNT